MSGKKGALTGIYSDAKRDGSTGSTGKAGDVTVTGRDIEVRNGGLINSNTFTQGQAGTVTIRAETGSLTVSNGGVISSATFAQGDAGTVTIKADQLRVSGAGAEALTFTGISSEAKEGLTGTAGNVTVTGRDIEVRSGTVEVHGGDIRLAEGGTITTQSDGSNIAGDVTIIADGSLSLTSGAQIASSATQANAGQITIRANENLTMTGSSITTEAPNGKGGRINLTAGRLALVLVSQSRISSSVRGGHSSSNAGDITIDTIDPRFVVLDRSQILAYAEGGGRNGNIQIIADIFIRSSDSIVAATGELAISGMIESSDMITPVNIKYIDARSLLPPACAARLGESKGSFRAAVHAAILPADPNRPLLPSSPSYTGHPPPDRVAPAPSSGAAEEGTRDGDAALDPVPAGAARLSFACGI